MRILAALLLCLLTGGGAAMAQDFGQAVSVSNGLVAGGTTQTTASLLHTKVNNFATVPPGAGATLPSIGSAGVQIAVQNSGANTLLVYPPIGGVVDRLAANIPYALLAGSGAQFTSLSTPTNGTYGWISQPYGTAAGGTSAGPIAAITSGTIINTAITASNITGGTANGLVSTNESLISPAITNGTASGLSSSNEALNTPAILGGTIIGASITSSTITNSAFSPTTITGGTFNAPAIVDGTLAAPAITGGTISSANITGGSITGATISGINLSGVAAITGGTISGLTSLGVNGPIIQTVTIVTASGAYSVSASDVLICMNQSTPAVVTVTLPSSPATARSVEIKDCAGNSATFPITVAPAAGTIDGKASFVIAIPYAAITAVYNGTSWSVF